MFIHLSIPSRSNLCTPEKGVCLQFEFIWFGVVLMVNMGMALITPPLGFALYIVKGILGEQVTLSEVLRGSLVFVIGEVVCIGLLMVFPIIALWLPNMMIAR